MVAHPCKTLALGFAALVLAADATAQQGIIAGRVTSRTSALPVRGATVSVRSTTGGAVSGATTNPEGEYRVTVSPGEYTVVVRLIPFAPDSVVAVRVTDGATAEANIALEDSPYLHARIDVTSDARPRPRGEGPGPVGDADPDAVETRVPATANDLLHNKIGFEFPKQGYQAGNPVFRGFNNVFSGSLLMLSDFRFAGVPSLRVNTSYLIPTPNEDIENVQFLLGPASALYGPNATSGVVHILSKSPFASEGTTVSVAAGERNMRRAAIRHAGASSSRFGYKISGMFLQADDWEYADPAETLPRNSDIERWSGEIRFDYKPNPNSTLILQGGRAVASTALEMTGIGTAQAKDWSNTYYQARFEWDRLFVQTFLNQNYTDDTRLLRTGQLIVDKSRVVAAQARHSLRLGGRQELAYGADVQLTDPRTEGTINGRNEDNDKITEYGAFIQSETKLTPRLDLLLSLRADQNSRLDDPEFSPRAALLFRPQPGHSFRLTFNSAFSTPTPNNLFLDVVAQRLNPQLPYFIRTLGVPSEGFRFRRDCAGGNGSLCMRSPFAAPAGATTLPFMPADVTLLWPAVKQLLVARGVDTTGLGTPTSAQIPTRLRIVTSPGDTISASQVRDVDPLRSNLVRSYEFGYTGNVADRFELIADVYYETRRDFTGPLIIETPNAFFDGPALVGYLMGRGRSQAQATAIAQVIGPIPFGTITPDNPLTQNADLMLTYRNFGKLERWGADLGFEALLTPALPPAARGTAWTVYGAYSWVNKNLFPAEEIGGAVDLPSNSPKTKGSLGLKLNQRPTGLLVDVRGRWVDKFPMNSGVFVGEVPSYTVVDATVAYRLGFANGMILSIDGSNILNKKHQELVGAPQIGRLVVTQLKVQF